MTAQFIHKHVDVIVRNYISYLFAEILFIHPAAPQSDNVELFCLCLVSSWCNI